MPLTRRALLALMSGSTYLLSAAARPLADLAPERALDGATFPQGVASGDPQPQAVMLWTRAEPVVSTGSVRLLVEVALDEDFSRVLLSQAVSCTPDSDYTLRAYIDGLSPDTRYYYRFRGAGEQVSRTGRTRTAPAAGADRRANVAFASCQSYEQGHYGSWARMIAEDRDAPEQEQIDFVLHLGDFIYERSWHKRIDGTPLARRIPPFPDGVATKEYDYAATLADYRHLYKTYLSDPNLQEARARWPFVCTWDDHEYSNDNYQSFSTYGGEHVPEPQRKQWANQAWFEYIPAVLEELADQPARDFRASALRGTDEDNNAAVDSLCIYRTLGWGRHVDIVVTDTRSYRSPPCVDEGLAQSLGLPLDSVTLIEIADGGADYAGGEPPDTLPYGDGSTPNPARDRPAGSMLGAAQRQWFIDTLANSRATWKLWGSALPLIPMRLDLSSLPFTDYEDSIFNVDAWAGYPHELRQLMDAVQQRGIGGLVSLSGDHHMHGAGTINRSASEPASPPVAADFTVAGISSSPIFGDLLAATQGADDEFGTLVFSQEGEETVPVWNMSMLDGVLPAFLYSATSLKGAARWLGPNEANPGLHYVDVTANGYGLATFEPGELTVRMVTVGDCRPAFSEPPGIERIARFRLPAWRAGDAPRLQGPAFERGAAFPFDLDNS
ncbi:MAG: alkaline phosphatase D family protein [Halioglobus sp.]|nr:alkaline phosphatase D family protein [Halioglobus sp.]